MNYIYKFPVVKGIQAGRDYYIAMVPLRMLTVLFAVDEEYVPPEYRAQRKLNEARIPVITRYILDNRDSYVFSAIAASIDGKAEFEPVIPGGNVGLLEIDMDAKFLINDGQHRKAAIVEALKEDPALGAETIPVVFFKDLALSRSQQIFTDLNKNAVRTSNSIAELYDSRDSMAVITRSVIYRIDFLNQYTDKEKDILGKYSSNLFTMNTFYIANKTIVGRGVPDTAEDFLLAFWDCVVRHMLPWQEMRDHVITKLDLRENYIATQSIVIQALARIGHELYLSPETDLESRLVMLEDVNWNRSAPCWAMRAIGKSGRIITNKRAAMLIANEIKKQLGLSLSKDELAAEQQLLNH